MSTLHLVHDARTALQRVAERARNGDALLLREDAVVLANGAAPPATLMGYVLAADARARGLPLRFNGWQIVEDEAFVDLVIHYPRSISWSALGA